MISRSVTSLPSWERGLKFDQQALEASINGVAPLVGAWIEIAQMLEGELALRVAPLVGAWIEIYR